MLNHNQFLNLPGWVRWSLSFLYVGFLSFSSPIIWANEDLDLSGKMLMISVRHGASNVGDDQTVIASTRQLKQGSDIQKIQVLENHEAFIRTGEMRPVVSQIQTDPQGVQQVNMDEQSFETGFWVKARTSKDGMVRLSIRIKKEEPTLNGSQHIEKNALETTLRVSKGQWTLVGSSGESDLSAQEGDTISVRKATTATESIWIKVD